MHILLFSRVHKTYYHFMNPALKNRVPIVAIWYSCTQGSTPASCKHFPCVRHTDVVADVPNFLPLCELWSTEVCCRFTVCPKADAPYPIVSVASIVAKVCCLPARSLALQHTCCHSSGHKVVGHWLCKLQY